MRTTISGKELFIFLNKKDLEAVAKGRLRAIYYQKGARLHLGMMTENRVSKKCLLTNSYKDPDVSIGFTPKDLRIKISSGDAIAPIHSYVEIKGALLPVRSPVESVKIFFPDSMTQSGYLCEEKMQCYVKAAA